MTGLEKKRGRVFSFLFIKVSFSFFQHVKERLCLSIRCGRGYARKKACKPSIYRFTRFVSGGERNFPVAVCFFISC